jgi:MSHA biogenesis protein MshI
MTRPVQHGGCVFGLLKRNAAAKGRVGIAIGSEQLAFAVVRREPGNAPVLERCEVMPFAQRVTAEAAAATLRSLNLPRMPVSSVLRPDDYQLALIEAPDVPPAELRAAMRWKLRDSIDFSVEDAVIDVFDVPAQSRGGQGRMMYAVAARRSAVDRQAAMLASLASLDVVDVPELCLRNLAGLLPAAANGLAALYLGANAATVVLVRGATFYFARQMNISVGGAGESEGRLSSESVVLELQRSLDYYERHFDQPPITRVAVAPAGAQAAALADDLGKESGFEVTLLDLNDLMQCASPVDGEAQAACLLAVGAALRQEHRSL